MSAPGKFRRHKEPSSDSRSNRWSASPKISLLIRGFILISPVIATWVAIRLISPVFIGEPYPLSFTASCVLWFLQAIIVACIASIATERLTRRLLPMAMLFNLSLAFPGVAPSRISLALRSQTVQKLLRHEEASEASYQAASLLMQLAKHDRLTRGHAERVRAYADVIAAELGLSDSDRNKLAWSALLHDVGKLHVPTEILNKKGKLNSDEYELMQNHPGDSTELMAGLSGWLGEWGLAASQHHEKFDGTGYPSGLAGEDISLAGRIVAAADAYDVMTSVRSYKKASPDIDARKELMRCSGTHFDPNIVRAFLHVAIPRRWQFGPLAWIAELFGTLAKVQIFPVTAAATSIAVVSTFGLVPPQVPTSLGYLDGDEARSEPIPELNSEELVEETTPAPPSSTTRRAQRSTLAQRPSPTTSGPNSKQPTTTPTTTTPPTSTTGTLNVPGTTVQGSGEPDSATNAPPVIPAKPTVTSPASPSSKQPAAEPPASTTIAPTTTTAPTTSPTTTTAPTTTTSPTTTTGPTTTTSPTTTTGPTTTVGDGSLAANDDSASIAPFRILRIDVLTNDEAGDSPLAPETVRIVGRPAPPSLYWVSNGRIFYISFGVTGVQTIMYEVCDEAKTCDTATVTIDVG